MVVFLAVPGFLAALFFLAAALGFLVAVFFLAMVFLTGDFFCGARQGAGQPSVRAHWRAAQESGSGGTPSPRASNCDRDSPVRRTGRRRAVGESYTGAAFAPRHPPPRAPERLLAALGLGGPRGREPRGRERGGGERTLASGESLKDALTLMNMPLETPNLSAFLSARSFCGWRHAHAA